MAYKQIIRFVAQCIPHIQLRIRYGEIVVYQRLLQSSNAVKADQQWISQLTFHHSNTCVIFERCRFMPMWSMQCQLNVMARFININLKVRSLTLWMYLKVSPFNCQLKLISYVWTLYYEQAKINKMTWACKLNNCEGVGCVGETETSPWLIN